MRNLLNRIRRIGAPNSSGSSIESLNVVSGDVATAMTAIRSAIGHVSEYVANTTAVVEEQSAATDDIASSMQRAAAELA
ncbi:methyl-accepting chemotaxis protein [Bradyrhizobium sp. S3.12.5]